MREIFNRLGCVEERWKSYLVPTLVTFSDLKCHTRGERMGIEHSSETQGGGSMDGPVQGSVLWPDLLQPKWS